MHFGALPPGRISSYLAFFISSLFLDDPQSSLLPLRHCHVPSLNHLSRTVIPEQLNKAALIHDDQTYQTFSSVIGLDVSDPDSWFQSCLPIRHGGFGLSRMQSVAPMAFLAAWAHTSRELSLRLNSHELIDNLFKRQSFEGSLSHHLSLAWATIQEQMPEKSLLSEKSLSQILEEPEKLQHSFTCTMADHDYNLLLGKENSHEVSARLRSVSGKGAGAFLQAIPTSNELALKPGEFRLAACLRLGLHLHFQEMQDKCDCGTHFDSFGYDLMTCKHEGGPVWAHDSIVSSWSECLSHEPLFLYWCLSAVFHP
ncbi:uncharacterized protein LOC134191608 [Corticium candelabrum]|uniref:uncharacterized protein LOC134191608 n=1 Tax=Corticium candelabrum TaxID=121492 RepID=UPI002E2668E1|nr:uncharacterized protein LOC134191608 [Corticium candelabrum]